MSDAFRIVKIIFAVGLCVAATVCLYANPGLVVPFGLTSLAWSMLPQA